jgi:hypothetical protein
LVTGFKAAGCGCGGGGNYVSAKTSSSAQPIKGVALLEVVI